MRIAGPSQSRIEPTKDESGKVGKSPGAESSSEDSGAVVSASVTDLASRVEGGAAERAARVEQLRLAVENGSYEPDLDQLAEKILDDEISRG